MCPFSASPSVCFTMDQPFLRHVVQAIDPPQILSGNTNPKFSKTLDLPRVYAPGRTVRVNVTRISNLGCIWPNFRGKFDWRCKNPGTWLPDCSQIGGQYFSIFSHGTSCVHPKTRRYNWCNTISKLITDTLLLRPAQWPCVLCRPKVYNKPVLPASFRAVAELFVHCISLGIPLMSDFCHPRHAVFVDHTQSPCQQLIRNSSIPNQFPFAHDEQNSPHGSCRLRRFARISSWISCCLTPALQRTASQWIFIIHVG